MPNPPESRARSRSAPLAPLAIAAAGGIVADRYGPGWPTATWALLALGLALAGWALRRRAAACWAIAAAVAALAGGWHHRNWSDLAPDDLARGDWSRPRPAWVRGILADVPRFRPPERPGEDGFTTTDLFIQQASDGRLWRPASGRVRLTVAGDRSDLAMGEAVEVAGAIGAVRGPRNPGEFDARAYLRARGIRLRMAVDDPSGLVADPAGVGSTGRRLLGRWRTWSHERLVAGLDPDVAPLAGALLLGRREGVDADDLDAFLRTGTMHLLAISGLHLQALAGALWLLARPVAGRRWAFATVLVATWGYALLVGMMPSIVRAAAMTSMFCLAGLCDRYARRANVLAAAALVVLILNPANLFDAGCQLSFLAIAAIFWLTAPVLRVMGVDAPEPAPRGFALQEQARAPADPLDALEWRLAPRWKKALWRLGRKARLALAVSLAVWVATLPLVWLRFHLVSPVAIVLNLPLVPLTTLALLLAGASLGVSTLWAPLGRPFGVACGWALDGTSWLVHRGVALPGGHAFAPGPAPVGLAAFAALLVLAAWAWATGRRSRRGWLAGIVAAAASAALMALPTRPPGATEVEVLDVGHGLSVLVRGADGRATLYDCGRMRDPHAGRRLIAPALWERGVRRLDAIILSHADSDHYNGLPDLLERFAVGEVRVPPGFGGPGNPEAEALLATLRGRGVPVRTAVAGQRLELGPGIAAEVLHPPRAWLASAPDNDGSLVLDLSSGGRHLLLTGDLEGAGLPELIAQPRRPVDVLLAPHHGGRSANPPWLYDWARPALVVVSQSEPPIPPKGLPGEPVVPALRTWRTGAVRLRWDGSAIVADAFLGGTWRVGGGPSRAVAGDRIERAALLAWPSWPGRAALAALGVAAGLAIVAALAVVEWGAWTLVRPGRTLAGSGPEPFPWEPFEAVADDGTRLRGALRVVPGSAGRTVVLLHGFAEDRSALLGRAKALAERGWNVALLDARGRGASGGEACTFGAREAGDLRAWLDALTERIGPGLRAAAWGRSMGAAIALRAAGGDDRLRALVLEAPYADLTGTVAAWLRRWSIPSGFAGPILARAGRLAGVSLARPRPIDLAPRVAAPTLILHGSADPVAPAAEVRRLADAFPTPPEVVEVPDARHHDVSDLGGPALADRIAAFLDRAIPDRAG